RHRIAGAPDHLVGRDIVAAGHPHGAAAGLPGVVLVLPGLAAGLARSRDRVLFPDELAGRRIEPGDPVAHAAVAAGGADDDLILDGERRSSELEIGLTVAHVRLPDDLASILIGRDDAWRIVCGRDHEVAPQRGATVGQREALLLGVHAPDDAAGL